MLPKLEGFTAALLGSLEASVLATVVSDLSSVEQTILSRADLRGVLTDTSITGTVRGQIVRDLLTNKVNASTLRLSVFAASSVPAQEVPHAFSELVAVALSYKEMGVFTPANLGLMNARKRVGGFADALLENLETSQFATIEAELFTWARTIEGNLALRRVLLDRDAHVASRVGTVEQLLGSKVHTVTLSLARYVIEGGRPRDVVGTLDYLVDYVAKARDWRVARVYTARALDAQSQSQLVASLSALTGKSVELQIAEDASLLGGVVVDVGDLHLDATTRGRLGVLHDAVASGRLYESSLSGNN